jgi:KUP system potassium uptake protein
MKGTAVYLAAHRETAPYALLDNLRHNKVLDERIVLLTVITERAPSERIKIEPLDKGFTEMSLHFGFAEAPAVPAALEAHRAEFPIAIAETSFFLGRETPVPTVRPEPPSWGAMPSARRITSRFRPSASSSWGHRSNSSRSV